MELTPGSATKRGSLLTKFFAIHGNDPSSLHQLIQIDTILLDFFSLVTVNTTPYLYLTIGTNDPTPTWLGTNQGGNPVGVIKYDMQLWFDSTGANTGYKRMTVPLLCGGIQLSSGADISVFVNMYAKSDLGLAPGLFGTV